MHPPKERLSICVINRRMTPIHQYTSHRKKVKYLQQQDWLQLSRHGSGHLDLQMLTIAISLEAQLHLQSQRAL